MSPPSPPYDIEALRREIPLLERMIPMNNCSQAPQSLCTRAAAEAYLDSWNRDGMDWDAWIGEVEGARAAFARLIGAEPDEVAVFSSVSHATSAVASAFDFTAGGRSASGSGHEIEPRQPDPERRRVLVSEAEFPTVAQVWLAQERRGAEIARVPVRDGAVPIEGYGPPLLDERTLLVSACHAYYRTGALQDVAEIARRAHQVGALVYVDAYQSLGTRPFDVRATEVDFLASGNLKFLMGVPGIAFLYVRPEVAERLEPTVTGWFGRADPFAFDPERLDWGPAARRFDGGTPPILPAYVARAGMEWLEEIGLRGVAEWTGLLSDRLVEGARARGLEVLGPTDSALKTPTTAFRSPIDSHRAEARMRERGVIVSARGPAVRLAPHFYTTPEDVEAALDQLAAVFREGA